MFYRLKGVSSPRKKTFLYIFLSLTLIVLTLTFGLTILVKISGLITDVKNTQTPINPDDNTPPAPPFLNNIPDYTNRSLIEVNGVVEAGATVVFTFNDENREVVANSEGKFTTSFNLQLGKNSLVAFAKDLESNVSQETEVYTIYYDNIPPEINFLEPPDGSEYYGPKQSQITLKGITEPETKLRINDRLIILDSNGAFSLPINLTEGENSFQAVVEDRAGNTTDKGITFRYWP